MRIIPYGEEVWLFINAEKWLLSEHPNFRSGALGCFEMCLIPTIQRRQMILLSLTSHRLQTCRASTCIIVVDEGSIVQSGTHSEMLSDEDNPYARVNKLQTDRWE